MKNILTLCDEEVAYVTHLMEYINSRSDIPLCAEAYTSYEALEADSAEKKELLLISEKTLAENDTDSIAKKSLVLCETGLSGEGCENLEINKYSPATAIVSNVLSLYDANKLVTNQVTRNGRVRVIGVYSPMGATGKTTFAIGLGQILSKKEPTLYVNLEGCSGLDDIICKEKTLSELLYSSHNVKSQEMIDISDYIVRLNELECIPPVRSFEDISETTADEWLSFFNMITASKQYENVVVEFGNDVADIVKLLDRCNEVYITTRADNSASIRIKKFEDMIGHSPYKSLLERITKIQMPVFANANYGREYYESLIWSEAGDWIRKNA